jgi:tape measure domain-containing protein
MRDKTKEAISTASSGADRLSGDYEELIKAIRESEEAMSKSGNTAKDAASGFGALGKSLAALGGAAMLKQLATRMIEVRSEIQMMEKSFEVLTGSEEAATGMLKELKELAVKSPLEMTDISKAAQTLLSFNISGQKVIPTLKQISDISMGDAQKFNSLTLAFAQMSSTGKLMGQDLMQMINAGFNPLATIAEQTGKSIAELKDEMSEGAISADMVAQAFEDATSEGGKFYNMTEKQAEGLAGLQASMGDAWTSMLNELGQSQEGLIAKGYKMTTSLIENYEKIGKAIMSLVATYGTYKAAVVLATVAEQGWTIAQMAQYKWLLLVEKAQKLLNKTMLANPYVLLATVVVGLVTTMWSLRDSTTAAEKAQERFNKTSEEAKQKAEEHKQKIEQLLSAVRDDAKANYERIIAMDELKKEYPSIFAQYDVEKLKLADILSIKRQIAEEDGRRALSDSKQTVSDIEQKISELEQNRKKDLRFKIAPLDRALTNAMYNDEKNTLLEELKLAKAEAGKLEQAMWKANTPVEVQKKLLEENIAGLKKQNEEIDDKLSAGSGAFGIRNPLDIAQYEANKKEIARMQAELDGMTPKTPAAETVTQNKTYWEGIKKDAENALASMDASLKGTEKWKELEAKIAAAQTQIDKYSPDKEGSKNADKDKADAEKKLQQEADAANKIIELDQKMQIERREIALETQEKILDAEAEGVDKRLKKAELDYQKELLAFDKFKLELIGKQQEKERLLWEQSGKNGTFSPTTTSVDQLSQEDKDLIAQREKAIEELHQSHLDELNKQAKKAMQDFLIEYGSYQEKIEAITEKYKDLMASAETDGDRQKLGKDRDKQLKELEDKQKKTAQVWKTMMGDMSGFSREMIEDFIAKGEELLAASADKADEETQNQVEALDRARQLLTDKNPFKTLHEALNAYHKALKDKDPAAVQRTFQALQVAAEEVKKTIDGITVAFSTVGGAISEDFGRAIETIGGIASAVSDAINTFGNESSSTGDKIKSISGIIAAATSAIGDFVNALDEPGRALREFEQYLQAFQNEMFLLENSIKDSDYETIFGTNEINRAMDAYDKLTEVQQRYIESQAKINDAARLNDVSMDMWGKDLHKMNEARRKALEEGYNEVQSMSLVVSEANWWQKLVGKGSRITTLKDIAPELWDSNGVFNVEAAKIFLETNQTINKENNKAQKETLENLIALKEQEEELMAIIDEQLSSVFGSLSGTITDAIFDSVRNGSNAWDIFEQAGAKVIDTLGKQLIKEMYIGAYLEQFQERMRDAYSKGSIEETQYELGQIMTDIFNGLGTVLEGAQKAAEDWDKRAAEQGWDMSSLTSDSGTSQTGRAGAFTTMTQDQATKLEGLFTSVQMHTATIDDNVADMASKMYSSLDCLLRIEENTSYCRRLDAIADDIATIKRDGLKVK